MIEFIGRAKDFAVNGLKEGTLYISNGVVRWTSGELKGKIHSHLQATSASEVVQQTALKLGELQHGQEAMQAMLGTISGGIKTLEVMTGLNLILGVADIGISVAGFALMNAKLNAVQGAIQAVSSGIGIIQQDAIDRDFIKLQAWAEQFENTWYIDDFRRSVPLLTDIAQGASEVQLLMESHAQKLLQGDLTLLPAADRMLDGMAVVLGLRVSAAMAANEGNLARKIADDGARRILELTSGLGEIDLVRAQLPQGLNPSSREWEAALSIAREEAKPLLAKLRSREGNALMRSSPLATLAAREITPRDWLLTARAEDREPFLFLAAA